MSMIELDTNLLEETEAIFRGMKASVIDAATHLHKVRESRAYEAKYASWGAFLKEGLDVSEGFASKLLSVYGKYVIEGGLSPEKLRGIDHEKLYLAGKLEGSVEEKLAKAQTLSRRELKEERNDEEPCDHAETYTACKKCHLSL